jgi:formate dehydrogenase subunit gamma
MLTPLCLNIPETRIEQTPAGSEPTVAPAALPAGAPAKSKILRFARSERMLHWAIAGPFLISLATALILVVIYNPDRTRPFRAVFSGIHRVSGVALILLPLLATFKSRGDARIHFYNIRQAWIWMFDDFKWLALMGLAAINSKIELPEQGKFNAAEKINFMVLMVTYPLYVATGLLMWLTHFAILSWLLHFFMAVLAVPLISGHLYMALINPGSRVGITGMISGFVDRQWAKHHYRRWYRDHHEAEEELMPDEVLAGPSSPPAAAHGGEGRMRRMTETATEDLGC